MVRPKLVSKKCTSGMRICRRVTRSICIPMSPADTCRRSADFSNPIDGETLIEIAQELLADRLLNFSRPLGFVAADRRCHRHGNALDNSCACGALAGKNRLHAMRLADPPLGHASIGGQAAVQMAGGGAVLIENVAADDRAQTLDVEKCVLDFQRIERPLDEVDAARESVLPLLRASSCARRR